MEFETSHSGQENDHLLTLEQVAVQLQVSRRSVERYIKSGHLPAVRLSARKLRVLQSDVNEFIIRMRQHNS